MNMWIVASVALSLFSVWYVGRPLLEPLTEQSAESAAGAARLVLLDKKERALRALKDLELDFAMGKVSAQDFESSKQSLALEAAAVLEELSQHDKR
jgi:hypothetical protein